MTTWKSAVPEQMISVRLRQQEPIPLNVEFSCGKNEILVIVGPSGSGKTTILRSIAGLYYSEYGKINCDGQTWLDTDIQKNISIQLRRVGMVFQHYALFPHFTVAQNIAVAFSNSNSEKTNGRITQLLQLVNMEGLESRYPHQLSGGQQQRVALARALARNPDVLLLDEPFSAVDQQTRRKLVRELVHIRNHIQIPMIHVTHNLNEARRIATKICVIHQGTTLQIDTPHNLMSRPVSVDVARQIGHYNIFTGKVFQHDDAQKKTYINWLDYRLETPYRPEFSPGMEIDWMIPAENLILHRRDRPSKGEKENPVRGIVQEFIPLGESSSITINVTDNHQSLFMSIPTHVARRNNIDIGAEVGVSLLNEGIHLMKKK